MDVYGLAVIWQSVEPGCWQADSHSSLDERDEPHGDCVGGLWPEGLCDSFDGVVVAGERVEWRAWTGRRDECWWQLVLLWWLIHLACDGCIGCCGLLCWWRLVVGCWDVGCLVSLCGVFLQLFDDSWCNDMDSDSDGFLFLFWSQ